MARVLPEQWRFSGRNRRPPQDPVNALFSLTYTLMLSEVERAVAQKGLDTALGFLHTPEPGRSALSLDLLEPLRAEADAFVLDVMSALLTPDHFSGSGTAGCRLSKEGRGLYYQRWAEKRPVWPHDPDTKAKEAEPTSIARRCDRLVLDWVRWLMADETGEGGHGDAA